MKCCSKCGEEKPLTEYYKQKSNKDGFYTYCKDCAYKKSREWFNKNRDKNLAYHVEYRKNNKDKIDEQIAKWKAENIEKKREYIRAHKQRNIEIIREKNRQYKKSNRDLVAKWAADRRANIKNASGFGNQELTELVTKEAYKVANLRSKATGVKHHVDHVLPLGGKEVCGFHVWNNLQVIPCHQNWSKGAKLLEEHT